MRYGRLGLLALLLFAAAPAWAQSIGSPGGGGFNRSQIHGTYAGEAGGACTPQGGPIVGFDAVSCNNYGIVLGGNWTFSNPVGLLPGEGQNFEIAQPSSGGPFVPVFGSRYSFSTGVVPQSCTTAGQANCFSTANNSIDYLPCTGSILQPGRLICGSLLQSIQGPTVTFVGAAGLGNVIATNLPATYTTGSGPNRLLTLEIVGDTAADDLTTVTYNGVAMTLVTKVQIPGDRFTYFYELVNPASGANTVSISASSSHLLSAVAADYQNAAQSGQPDAFNTATNAGATTMTASLTTVKPNTLVVAMVSDAANSSTTTISSPNLTVRANSGSLQLPWVLDGVTGVTPGAHTYTINSSPSSAMAVILVSFSPP